MLRPSDDHVGCVSDAESDVSRCLLPPDVFITQGSPWPLLIRVNAMSRPSGETDGSMSYAPLVKRTRPVPLSATLAIEYVPSTCSLANTIAVPSGVNVGFSCRYARWIT